MGAKHYGPKRQREKRLLIFDKEKYRYQKLVSDIAGMDIHAHGGKPTALLGPRRSQYRHHERTKQLVGFSGRCVTALIKPPV